MKRRELAAIGFMTFALFLGAGNLIFPPLMAQQAGENWLSAIAGFLITAVGLPALTLVVLGKLPSIDRLTSALPAWMDRGFWILILTTIGPAFALPRAVTVAYEMGIKPFSSGDGLFLFSILFCALTLVLAIKPGKLINYIGRIMTPALIAMLGLLTVFALFNPLGSPSKATDIYQSAPVVNGLIQGYMTLDAIAAVVFGWVIINTIRTTSSQDKETSFRDTLIIVGIYAALMALCYLSMGYLGATSSNIAPNASNGGEILAAYAAGQFGAFGQILLASITLIACLTTTVGITTANAEYYKNTYGINVKLSAIVVTFLTATISNVGLETIIQVSLPVILILCPIAIALILSVIFIPKAGEPKQRCASMGQTMVVLISGVFGTLDALNILGKLPDFVSDTATHYLPLFPDNMSWLMPSLVTMALVRITRQFMASKQPLFG
ncbi:branched-chain amino acid transport system II carrier protein [Enterovibrio makurazakiensis]|uniref:branched-chain amino acid transport system II carrier protein n=1 Tax=Enterovibrio makurazakiensis TaxID=2910232 RepID=UPI003D23A029